MSSIDLLNTKQEKLLIHEKNVRYGHISTLYIWPARRPRAALIATLLADLGMTATLNRDFQILHLTA